MFEEFIFDLKVARKKSGLTQADCGHLIGVSGTVICQLENGNRLPTIKEISALSLIYGRSFESLFGPMFVEIRKELAENLLSLPESGNDWMGAVDREHTIDALEKRLDDETNLTYVY